MLLIAIRKGGVKCSSACPFYAETGVVRGINGPLRTHCRATMEKIIVDCDAYDPKHIEKIEVTEEQWKAMQRAVHKRAKRVIKPLPKDHAEIHPVGWSWRNQDKWNASKSSNVKQ